MCTLCLCIQTFSENTLHQRFSGQNMYEFISTLNFVMPLLLFLVSCLKYPHFQLCMLEQPSMLADGTFVSVATLKSIKKAIKRIVSWMVVCKVFLLLFLFRICSLSHISWPVIIDVCLSSACNVTPD